jgi:hypothetical protein
MEGYKHENTHVGDEIYQKENTDINCPLISKMEVITRKVIQMATTTTTTITTTTTTTTTTQYYYWPRGRHKIGRDISPCYSTETL